MRYLDSLVCFGTIWVFVPPRSKRGGQRRVRERHVRLARACVRRGEGQRPDRPDRPSQREGSFHLTNGSAFAPNVYYRIFQHQAVNPKRCT